MTQQITYTIKKATHEINISIDKSWFERLGEEAEAEFQKDLDKVLDTLGIAMKVQG
jgi:hypothetical protein